VFLPTRIRERALELPDPADAIEGAIRTSRTERDGKKTGTSI